jgi:N-acetylmuramic acid 6-phosphate etherase
MPTRSKWGALPTEAASRLSRNLDSMTVNEIVELMVADGRRASAAVQAEKAHIAKGAAIVADAVRRRGRLIFVGAGTSGRLAVLEAAELPPTFGIAPSTAIAMMAGGRSAVFRAKEGAEDNSADGRRIMTRLRPSARDVVVAISASGVTPFVLGAVSHAARTRARIVAITCDARSQLRRLADVAIVLNVGPEVIAGSTRLKAGTATKMALNMLTTIAMVRAGKTFGNLMVDVRSNSDKLRDRARRIVSTITALPEEGAAALLRKAGGSAKVAVVMQATGETRARAVSRLRVEPRLRKLLRRR